jgi:hypothetical protein
MPPMGTCNVIVDQWWRGECVCVRARLCGGGGGSVCGGGLMVMMVVVVGGGWWW